ncbi:hypothetical protein QR680_002061 [Steinernema hermaphroditum]|uniref:Neurotransmitter-gated ion-channel ligand-binding domain-containing protein n=1 Tax=Steinernema hermaphroditum TaxID=289476 RepID=A0AA39LGW8_9BILA|nr:hypothetical protein QR680_002061 [Steinernema hermaphroditum]
MQTVSLHGRRSVFWNMSLALFQLLNILTLPSQGEQNNEIAAVSKTLTELNKNLFKNYDSSLPDTESGPTTVSSLTLIQHIQSLDPKQETLKFHADLTMSWFDTRLRWNPSDYNNVQEINVFKHLHNTIWWPQLFIRGVVSSSRKVVDYHNTEAILRHEGLVITTSSITVEAKCSMDYSQFPHDSASCIFYMGAPLYSASVFRFSEEQMIYGNDLFNANETVKGSGDFKMTKGEAYVFYVTLGGITRNYTAVQNNPFTRSYVRFEITLRRNPTHFFLSTSLPTFALTLFSFASATVAQSYASIIWLFCCLVLQVINSTVMIKGLPPNYDSTPLCAKVAMVSMIETCLLLIYRIVMNHFYKSTQGCATKRQIVKRVEFGVTAALCVHVILNFWLIVY